MLRWMNVFIRLVHAERNVESDKFILRFVTLLDMPRTVVHSGAKTDFVAEILILKTTRFLQNN